MKRKIVLAAVCFVAYSLLLTFSPVFAATNYVEGYSGAWEAVGENDNVFVMNINVSSTFVDDLGIYDVTDTTQIYALSFNTLNLGPANMYSSQLAFKWSDDYNEGEGAYQIIDYTSIESGDFTDYYFKTLKFGFSLKNEVTVEYDYYQNTANSYTLYFDDMNILSVNNANPVPLPTALVLLGSGLVGLVGFRRKTVR